MKVNVNKLTPVVFLQMVKEVEQASGIEPSKLIEMQWHTFWDSLIKIQGRLSLILPAKYHKGLEFKIVDNPFYQSDISKYDRATWITLKRGSKDWFIVNIEVDYPAVGTIHPQNMCVNEDNHDFLWAIINMVTSPNWFNDY